MLQIVRRYVGPALLLGAFAVAPVLAASPAPQKATSKAAPPAGKIDINSASEKDLDTLPGVGPATAKKIIAGRPYTSVADLAKAGVPKATIDKITPLVVVTAGAAPATPAAPSAPKVTATAPASPAAASTPSSTVTRSAPATAASGTAATPQQPPSPGMVWVNIDTKVYHKAGDRYYGNTKHGKWMTEADAIAAGYRASKGK